MAVRITIKVAIHFFFYVAVGFVAIGYDVAISVAVGSSVAVGIGVAVGISMAVGFSVAVWNLSIVVVVVCYFNLLFCSVLLVSLNIEVHEENYEYCRVKD